jgi:hypothetical protein
MRQNPQSQDSTSPRPPSNPFSQEVPQLLQSHLDHLLASGIALEIIRERGYVSVLGRNQPIPSLGGKTLAELGFATYQTRIPAILMPLHGVHGQVVGYQLRPDDPRLNEKGKPTKYETPRGASNRLDVPPRCQEALGNPHVPLFVTEGIKKADSLASAGACAIALAGVFSWRGRNEAGGKTALPDLEYIAFNDRKVYLAFDSDAWTNRQVRAALLRLRALAEQKGAEVRAVPLEPGKDGAKVGIDDYLAQGHNLEDILALVEECEKDVFSPPPKEPRGGPREQGKYAIERGCFCEVRYTKDGDQVLIPLSNFAARVTQELIKDNGIDVSRTFKLAGTLASGRLLPEEEISAEGFSSLSWLKAKWGAAPIIAAGTTAKDKVREAIELASGDVHERRVYTHSGWRVVEGVRCFLTASGALGREGVEVELERGLDRYRLPLQPQEVPQAMAKSLEFLAVGPHEISMPLWGAMYLAPLSELLNPAFTLWLVGPSGALKTTVAALALCHFGEFDTRTVPAQWRDTANYLEKALCLAKDLPLLIDDFAPQVGGEDLRKLEDKIEVVDRAQGNRTGRARLKSDTSTRGRYNPRGMAIATGETLPSGHQSRMAREFVLNLEKGMVNFSRLSQAQKDAAQYPHAMAGYVLWLRDHWEDLADGKLEVQWRAVRDKAQKEGQHLRLPEAVAWLSLGFALGTQFAQEVGALSPSQGEELRKEAWDILLNLAEAQGLRVEEERPANRFLAVLGTLLAQDRAVLISRLGADGAKPAPHQELIGYQDQDFVYLLPEAVYKAVANFCRSQGQLFSWNPLAVKRDLDRLGLLFHPEGRLTDFIRFADGQARVLRIPQEKWRAWTRLDPEND